MDNISAKSLKREIDKINIRRGYMLALTMSITFFVCAVIVIASVGVVVETVFVIGAFLTQAVYAVVFYLGRNGINEAGTDKSSGVYISYYVVSFFEFFLFAMNDIANTKSSLLYVLSMLGVIFVPVLWQTVRRIFQIALMICTIIGCILGINCGREVRNIVDLCLISIVCLLLMEYQQSMRIRNAVMELRLKRNKKSSEHDALTGLMNRRGLERKVAEIWDKCIDKKLPVAMIELDIDFFKKYNDAFGHPKGDECLKIVADSLLEAVQGKGLVTRTGGEEFIVLAYNISKKDFLLLAERIRTTIYKKKIKQDYVAVSNYVTVSMGLYYAVPLEGEDLSLYYDEADRALYMAKENGRNCMVLDGNLYGRMKNEPIRLST